MLVVVMKNIELNLEKQTLEVCEKLWNTMHLIGNDEEIIMLINTNKVALKYHRSHKHIL